MRGDGSRAAALSPDTSGTEPRRPRRPRRDEVAAARTALAVLDKLSTEADHQAGRSRELTARMLRDPRLLTPTEVLMPYPPVRVACRCGCALGWLTLTPLSDRGFQLDHAARLKEPKQRQGVHDALSGVHIMNTEWRKTWEVWEVLHAQTSAAEPPEAHLRNSEASVGNVKAHQSGAHGDVFGLKVTYVCPRCAQAFTSLHVTLLRQWLHAVINGERVITLGKEPGVPQTSKTRAVRVEDRGPARAWSTRTSRRKR